MTAAGSQNGHDSPMKTDTQWDGRHSGSATPYSAHMSPSHGLSTKSVAFELLFPESPQYKARLPMRVQIHYHDTTASIVETVKNFYGLYNAHGHNRAISFEDRQGNTLIACYKNLSDGMTVYVRVTDEAPSTYDRQSYHSASPVHAQYLAGEQYQMPPPPPAQALTYGQPPTRPASGASERGSASPSRGRQIGAVSTTASGVSKARSRSGYKSRGSSTHGSFPDIHSDGLTGYSSGDGAPNSVSSRTKSEQLGNTEISLDNIVEGGRRKRAKFESSELPLFAPPQMPAATSNSSVSPARRTEHHRPSYPFAHPSQHPFTHPTHVMHSPQSTGNGFGQPNMYATPANSNRQRGGESSSRHSYGSTPIGNSSGILPTPDPTIGSCVSEEDKDVALQLMRLGEMSNISHGRTSASTLDDTFSGRADAASSAEEASESESEPEPELPPARRQKREPSPILPPGMTRKYPKHIENVLPSQETTDPSGDENDYEDGHDQTFKPEIQDELLNDLDQMVKTKMPKSRSTSQMIGKPKMVQPAIKLQKVSKPIKARSGPPGKTKTKLPTGAPGSKPPISPTSMPPQSRKASVASALNFQHQLGEDEEDLSSKPRCQRCRKSKKGCDRQRPCQRCKDAGLSADQCVSEDEGNGRKGRYGRHMGVPVKKEDMPGFVSANASAEGTAGGLGHPDKSKKRKR